MILVYCELILTVVLSSLTHFLTQLQPQDPFLVDNKIINRRLQKKFSTNLNNKLSQHFNLLDLIVRDPTYSICRTIRWELDFHNNKYMLIYTVKWLLGSYLCLYLYFEILQPEL